MSLKAEEVIKIAKLSRIKLQEEEIGFFQEELSKILNWIDMLKEVDTKDVPQMISVIDQPLELHEDIVSDGNNVAAVLKNAPNADYGCFIVPKVVE